MIHDTLRQLAAGSPLTEAQAEALFEDILTGKVDEAQIGSILTAIAMRAPAVDELVAGARVMRRHVTQVVVPPEALDAGPEAPRLIDTCGTGGAPKTFNVSTVGAIVTAAAAPGRVMVAKHGSRSRTGRGSAEVMERLGVNVAASPETQTLCLREIGVCFSFAIHHHPAMKFAAGPRRSLGFPTIFNLLGPLTNPAGARRQLIGTYCADLALRVAETLARLGADRAMVVTTHDGLDELTTTNTNITHNVADGVITTRIVDAHALGLQRARLHDLQARDLDHAVAIIESVLAGEEGPHLDIVLLNAAGALVVADVADDLARGVEMARQAVRSGRARQTMDDLRRLSNG